MLNLTLSIKPTATKAGGGRTAQANAEFDGALNALSTNPATVLDVIPANRVATLPAAGKRKVATEANAQQLARSLASSFSQYAAARNTRVGTLVRMVSTFDPSTVAALTNAGFKGEDYAVIALDTPTKTRKAKGSK